MRLIPVPFSSELSILTCFSAYPVLLPLFQISPLIGVGYTHSPAAAGRLANMDSSLPNLAGFLSQTPNACLVAASVGVLSHVLYWIRGIRDTQAPQIIVFHLVSYGLLLLQAVAEKGILGGLVSSTLIFSSYLGALFTSITVYRLFFHPLRRFPGPTAAKITKLYGGPWLARNGKLHEEHLQLCRTYGSFVRSGRPPRIQYLFMGADMKQDPMS